MDTITDSGFSKQLVARVNGCITDDLLRQAHRRLHRKAAVVLAWYIASGGLVLLAHGWVFGAIACVSLGLSIGAIGVNIQHDANHNAFFATRGGRRLSTANRIAGYSLEMIGGNSKGWIEIHGRIHHSSTNIAGKDGDIDLGPFARLAPSQQRRRWHAYQHLYIWALYGLTTTYIFGADVGRAVMRLVSGNRSGATTSVTEDAALVVRKATFVAVMLGAPMLLHPWWTVLLGALVVLGVSGVALGLVFQLAHVVEEAEFADCADPPSTRWHEWQVRSTVDFCPGPGPGARIVTWCAGGLNYQIEHHLFPSLPHTLYPAIAPAVADVCAEFGIRYHVHPTLRSALRSHYRHLRGLSRPPGTTVALTAANL